MFENITERFENFEIDKDYWFIRTSKGRNFASFTNRGFIGIGWNYITTQDLRELTPLEIKSKIARLEPNSEGGIGYNSETTKGKTKITGIYNKIKKFEALKEGDLVIIPSNGSSMLSFGYIADEEIFNNFEDNDCNYHKRRRVNWIVTKTLSQLDPIFYKIIFSKHAVSSINDYASHIDKVVSGVFVKNDYSHVVIDVQHQEDINIDSLTGLMSSMRELTSLLNQEFQLGDNFEENSVKLNVQSPGSIEFIYHRGRSLLLSAVILATPMVVSCSHSEAQTNATPSEIADEKANNISSLKNTIENNNSFTRREKDSLSGFVEVNYDSIANAKKRMQELSANVDAQNLIN